MERKLWGDVYTIVKYIINYIPFSENCVGTGSNPDTFCDSKKPRRKIPRGFMLLLTNSYIYFTMI